MYKVSADTFEQIDEYQWISFKPVKPIEYEIIDPKKYLHWIEKHEQKNNGNR
ncbi:MAG: hypothetical protein KAW92_00825 [Candidatus Cloacimonetes bacterium]|nr:hypothetical protein [Candidatus Cloacimonadota bacterium]